MKYSIALKNLPFEPERRHVIYVENQYDERINAFIKDNYDQLRWTFKRSNLDFIYFPMFFNDEEIKEKVLYYAPYLTTEIIEKAELRSSYLLSYMSHQENREKITPSLLYSPQKEDDEWIFQGQTIDIDGDERNLIIQWFENVVAEIEEAVILKPKHLERRYDEDIDEGTPYRSNEEWADEEPQVEYSSTPSLWDKFKRETQKFSRSDEGSITTSEQEPSSLDEILDEDVRETLEELEKKIERLRLLGIPLTVIVEFVAKYETISRLRLTDDYKIILPDYGNREVQMGPLCKAMFFLFLNHPEGIVLKRLEEHHRELANYYLQTSHKKELSPVMLARINNLEYPGNDNINVVLSRINKYFRKTIDEHLAKHYYIVGKPGEPYKIALDNIIIEWEDEDE